MLSKFRAFGLVMGLVAAMAALAPACGGVSADKACTDLAAAMCNKNAQCNALTISRNWGDLATCQQREKQACVNNLSAKGTANTPDTTEACASAYPAWDCQSFMLNNPPTACVPGAGRGASGAGCSVSAQCSSTYCSIQSGVECGNCAALPQVGDSCVTTGCGRGLICDRNQTCATPVQDGGSCGMAAPCAPGFNCVGGAANATCQPSITTAGSRCDPSLATLPTCSAAAGLVCTGRAGAQICVVPTFAGGGQGCGASDGGFVLCSAAGDCIQRACVASAADSQPCNSNGNIGPSCMPPARCITGGADAGTTAGTCVFPTPSDCVP